MLRPSFPGDGDGAGDVLEVQAAIPQTTNSEHKGAVNRRVEAAGAGMNGGPIRRDRPIRFP